MGFLTTDRSHCATTSEEMRQIEAQLACRLGSRIREFQLDENDGGLVIRGWTATYYAKQLAQEAVMETVRRPILANEIEVR